MAWPLIALGIAAGAKVFGAHSKSQAEKRAREQRKEAIRRALMELSPQQIASIEAQLLPAISGVQSGMAAGAEQPLTELGRNIGVDPSGAIGGMRSAATNTAATQAFQNAMSLAPTRAGVHYGQAQNIYPDYRRAQTFNTI